MSGGKSGMEAMFRSLGLGEVLDAANQLAASGAIPKIIGFADAVGPLAAAIARVERKLDCLAAQSSTNAPDGSAWSDYDWDGGLDGVGREPSAGGAAIGRGDIGGSGGGVIIEARAIGEVL